MWVTLNVRFREMIQNRDTSKRTMNWKFSVTRNNTWLSKWFRMNFYVRFHFPWNNLRFGYSCTMYTCKFWLVECFSLCKHIYRRNRANECTKEKERGGAWQGDRVLDMAMADKFTQACILLSILITIIEGIEPNAFEHICSGIDCKLIWQ